MRLPTTLQRPIRLPLTRPLPHMARYFPLDEVTQIKQDYQLDVMGGVEGVFSAQEAVGRIAEALNFNGSSHYLNLEYSRDVEATEALTIAFFLKAAAGSTGVILGVGNVFPDTSWNRIQFNYSTPNLRLYVKDDAGNVRQHTTTATVLDSAWHSIVGVISPVDNVVKVFVDASLDGQASGALGKITLDGNKFHAGCLYNDGSRGDYAPGTLDEIIFAEEAWTKNQVIDYHNGVFIR